MQSKLTNTCSFPTWTRLFFFLPTDCLAEQNPAPMFALNFEDILNNQFIGTILLSEEHPSLSPPLYSSSTAINAESQSSISSSEAVDCSIKDSGDTGKALPSHGSQDTQPSRIPQSFMEQMLIQRKTSRRTNDVPAGSCSPVTVATITREEPLNNMPSNTTVRRTKSEACVQAAGQAQSIVPVVRTDATTGDRLWSKLKPSSQRDSASSSSSISSSETVIDMSLPQPVENRFSTVSRSCDPTWFTCSRSPLSPPHPVPINKSKSQPNLWQGEDEATPSPVLPPQDIPMDSPSKPIQRRHTWSRLYMEELKQSAVSRLPSAATSPDSMSKSLGDLTSDDIFCHFDSTYRSISRSVSRSAISRPGRDRRQLRTSDNLTEQLRRLASVEPLTAKDFVVASRAEELEEEAVNETGVRRTSRSQSRVRYIANRAKKEQERQRIQGLLQGRSASFSIPACAGSSNRSSPIEERGSPEGACSIAGSSCTSEELLEQLNFLASPSPRLSQLPDHPENTQVFFLLRLWDDKTAQFYSRETLFLSRSQILRFT